MRISEIYLLWWRWSDGSAMGFIRAYTDKVEADREYEMLKTVVGDRDIYLTEVALYEDN